MNQNPILSEEAVDQISAILKAHNVKVATNDREFWESLNEYTFLAQFKWAVFHKSFADIRLKEYRNNITRIKGACEGALAVINQLSSSEISIFKHQIVRFKVENGFQSPDDFDEFVRLLHCMINTEREIVSTWGKLSPGAPLLKHSQKEIKFEYAQCITSLCMNDLDKQPTSFREGYLCELLGCLLEVVTGNPHNDTYDLVHDVFSYKQLPDPKFG